MPPPNDPGSSLREKILVNAGVILVCATIGGFVAWIFPVAEASPYTDDPGWRDHAQAMHNLTTDSGDQKVHRAMWGALAGAALGAGWCVWLKFRKKNL